MGFRRQLAHHSHDEAGVEAPTEERPNGNITHHVIADRLDDTLLELVQQVRLARRELRLVGRGPVALDSETIVLAQQVGAGGSLRTFANMVRAAR
jgi:hypothetical protein